MARFSHVRVVLRFLVQNVGEADAIAAALAVDDESDSCSRVLTSREREGVVVEIECWCSSSLTRARSIADDVLRGVSALTLPLVALEIDQRGSRGVERQRKA